MSDKELPKEQKKPPGDPLFPMAEDEAADLYKELVSDIDKKIEFHQKESQRSLNLVYISLYIILLIIVFANVIVGFGRKMFTEDSKRPSIHRSLTIAKHRRQRDSLAYTDTTVIIDSPFVQSNPKIVKP